MSRIDLFLNSLRHCLDTVGDLVPWPIDVATVFPYFSDLEAQDLYAKLREIRARKLSDQTIIESLFIGPSVTKSTLLTDAIIGMKASVPVIPAEERIWFVETVFDLLERWQPGDIFCQQRYEPYIAT